MAAQPVPITYRPEPLGRSCWPEPRTERSCWPAQPVSSVDWFRRMPNGGGTVYRRPVS